MEPRRRRRLSVSALAREYPISLAAVQKHVAVLERAELTSPEFRQSRLSPQIPILEK